MGEVWSRLNERQKRIFSWLAVGLIVGVGILVVQPSTPTKTPPASTAVQALDNASSDSLQEHLERKLTAILNSMLGGKHVDVFLTMERGSQLKIAYDHTEEERFGPEGLSERRWTSSPVLMRNDADRKEVPLVLEEIAPTVRGVLVVIDREPHTELRLAVSQAVATALQVPMYRIEVLFTQ
ncbi:MAG TPA: hypothetical protein GXZ85_00490 [Firmicutes bacterium]|jgi:stage III sporulation protein AG|nr:hypothetical protein [Bacillota bacterium]